MVLENFLIDVDVLWDRVGKELYEKPDARAGRVMRVRVVNRGIVEDLAGYTLNLGWRNAKDETKFGLDAFTAIDITKGIFELHYTSGMLSNYGVLIGTLQLVPSVGGVIESNNFVITVKRSGVDAEAIQSETSFQALEIALVQVNGWNATIGGKVEDWEADMAATKQLYIDNMNEVELTYPQELVSLGQQLEQVVPYGNLEIKSVNWYVRAAGEFTSARAEEILNRLVLDGFNSVTIIPMRYMSLYTSNEIVSTDIKTPPDSDIVAVIQNAHSKGLSVVLKPHVEVNDGTPRSNIAPTDTSAWFTSYNNYIVRMAQIAQANNVEYFVVGTELQSVSSSAYKSNWETVIANVRGAFAGVITYAAIWGSESASCSFWELVDYIGINLWDQRTDKDPYTLQDIYDSFYKNYVGATDMYSLKNLSNTYAKPILLTEIGCISYSGALARPAVYEGVSDPIDNQVPADFAEAMYTVLSQNVDWIKGFCWWDIHNNVSDLFSFEGKPAELVLKKWNTKDYRETEPLHNLSKTHGFDIFTEENHNSNGNPHTQYLLKSPAYRINQITSSADLNKYSLVMQVRLTDIYNAQDVLFDVFGTTSGNYPVEYGSIYFRVYQYAAMGIEPYIDLIVDGNSALKAANFVAVITKNDSLETVVKLYYKATLTNEYIAYHIKSDVVSPIGHQYITYYDSQTYSATLPSGTQKTPTYPDKQFNSIKIGSGNYEVLNSNTHNSTGDPHTQYAKVSSRASIQQATALGYYGKFASITLPSQYSGSVSLFSVTGYAHPTSPQKGLLWVRCYQNGVLGSVPTIEMKLFNARGLKPSDFIAVIKQNDGTATVIEIYVSLRVIYDTLFMNMIHSEKGNITLYNNQALVTSLPAGTQILATYDDVALTSSNGTNYKLVVDNAGLLSTVVLP